MDPILAKIFATALVFSQVAIDPSELRTRFDDNQDVHRVSELLRSGCAHMRKAFDIEDLNLDDLIATAMEDVDASSANDQVVLRGINLKELHLAYRQFCNNEDISESPIDIGEIIKFYNNTLADLPSSLEVAELKPPGTTTIIALTGEPLQQRRTWTSIENVPSHVQQAFVAAEDKRFYEHRGIDERALVRAFIANFARPGRLQGGSTITQQVVKNLLVGSEVAYERKMREMVLASRMEGVTTKAKILELYLNSIYLGRGAWGIEAAAQSYFGKSVASLNVSEAALLAGLAKGPNFYNPERFAARSRERTEYVLGRMLEEGFLDAHSARLALNSLPISLVAYEGLPQGSHFADYVGREGKAVLKTDLFGADAYTVHTTIHPLLQAAAESALQEGLTRYERSAGRVDFQGAEINLADAVARLNSEVTAGEGGPAWQQALRKVRLPLPDIHWTPAIVIYEITGRASRTVRVGIADGRIFPLALDRVASSKLKPYDVVQVRLVESKGKAVRAELRVRPAVQGAVVVIENKSGRILAMAGGFSYALSQLNRVTQSQRQPGSSLKPLVYLAALQRGLQPNTLIRDDAVTYPPIGGTRNARSEDYWTPKNYDGGDGGIITLRQAIETSRNLATARLLDGIEAAPSQSLDEICRLGQHLRIYSECMRYYPFVLGAQPVRPLDMAVFYATVANEGFRPTPYAIDKVRLSGKTLYQHDNQLEEVTLVDRASFYQLKTMLQGVLARGTARSLAYMAPYVAGKTGTTDGENDAWFVAFSNDVTIAVWVGYDNADGRRRTLGSGRTGGNVAIPIFEPIMQAVWSHHSPKTALRPASPEAKSKLVAGHAGSKAGKSRGAALLPEYLRRDQKSRTVDAQYRLLSRKDREAYAAGQSSTRRRTTQREQERLTFDTRQDPWSSRQGWFGWQGAWRGDDSAWRGGRGFW